MARKSASGYTLKKSDAPIILGMDARGDRDHDIAAWFGVNQGRIPDIKDGSRFGVLTPAPHEQLPPKGPPGVKGRRLREAVGRAIEMLEKDDLPKALSELRAAVKKYDSHEA